MLHQLPGLAGQSRGLQDGRLADALFGVGPMCDLIDVVADGRQLPQQRSVLIRRPRAELRAGQHLTDNHARTKPRRSTNLSEVFILFGIQPYTNIVISFSHNSSVLADIYYGYLFGLGNTSFLKLLSKTFVSIKRKASTKVILLYEKMLKSRKQIINTIKIKFKVRITYQFTVTMHSLEST